jgi:hypothetical protein
MGEIKEFIKKKKESIRHSSFIKRGVGKQMQMLWSNSLD